MTAATPQIKVQSVRLIGFADADGGLMVVEAGSSERVALAVAVFLNLGEVSSVGPRHHRQQRVRRGTQAVSDSNSARQKVPANNHQESQTVQAEETRRSATPASRRVLGARPIRDAPSETISP